MNRGSLIDRGCALPGPNAGADTNASGKQSAVTLPPAAVTWEQAQAALDAWARPATQSHAGDVRIVSVDERGVVTVEFSGACRACPLQPVTFATAVLPAFDQIPGVADVRCETVRVSPHAMRRMRALMQS